MDTARLGKIVFLCAAVVFLVCIVASGPAHAAAPAAKASSKTNKTDKELASKEGLDIFDRPAEKVDDPRTPTKVKKMIGVGSIFVMIAVVKWL